MFRKKIARTVSLPINEEESIKEEFIAFLSSHFPKSCTSTIIRRVEDVKSQIDVKLNRSSIIENSHKTDGNVLDDISQNVQMLYADLQALVKDGRQPHGKNYFVMPS